LDTNIAIYLAQRHRLAERYRPHIDGFLLALSFATVAELFFTARKSRDPAATVAYWRRVLPTYVVLYPDLTLCEIWADIVAGVRARGRVMQDNDAWIAATAIRYGVPLVTHNGRDFVGIEGLDLITLPDTAQA
jgi:tRNA(fMet)-specific endonuclease VapC